jgi:hypothetical protein
VKACYNTFQNFLSSRLPPKSFKIKLCVTIIFSFVLLARCETWSITLNEEQLLTVFENRVMRKVLGPKREEPIPVAAPSKAPVCGRSLAGIVGLNPAGDGCLSLVSVVCFQVQLSATGRSLLQRSLTVCVCVCVCVYVCVCVCVCVCQCDH